MSIVEKVYNIVKEKSTTIQANDLLEVAESKYKKLVENKIIEPKESILYPIEKNPYVIFNYNQFNTAK